MKKLSLRRVTTVLFAVALPAFAQGQNGDIAARVDKVFEQNDLRRIAAG